MSVKVGIPRAMLYYYYYPMWKVFFNSLGVEVVLSDLTNKQILTKGLHLAVDEACLPVKVAFGHVTELADKVDYLFIPRMVSIFPREYICPKFLGLPDMLRQNIQGLPTTIDVNINSYKNEKNIFHAFYEIGRYFTNNNLRIRMAYGKALKAQNNYWDLLARGFTPEKTFMYIERGEMPPDEKELPVEKSYKVAVIGHPYNVYDPYISMNIINKLQKMGTQVVTAESLPEHIVRQEAAARLPKRLFWTLGQRMIGAAYKYLDSDEIDGLIQIAAFGCGPDSMIGDLIERQARRVGRVPFLNITLDEHTGEAGIVTRLEAFMDMVKWRRVV
ncbi:acyl-CoA dehydratase activase-related protein [Desulfolucanica intricata]|uniref:acyl-CoA dehydratase activase-related protein n=1 Tax=Desulfolucanica intricata TaxID=1285191 RepID=UPI000834D6AD|nr:acyl-CoA dehydratase activase-related protein [Desulfolucanica intricata]